METSPPEWFAIAVAVIALVGVLVAQIITLYNERVRRRDEQTKSVREDVHEVMMVFFEFAEFAASPRSITRIENECDAYHDRWAEVAGPLTAKVANMAGRGKHRNVALSLMDGIAIQAFAYREGESVGKNARAGYVQMAWAGFEVVAAWLRSESVPRHSRGVARDARRMRERLDDEYGWRTLIQNGSHRSGVLRHAFRKLRRAAKAAWKKRAADPVAKAWMFLFAK